MNTNNTTCLSELAFPRLRTTNAHAPVGDELVAFDSSIFLSANFERLENFGSVSQKCILRMQRYYYSLKHPNISLFYFSIGNDLYINNVICDAKLHHLLHSTTLFIRNLFYNFSYHTKLFETQTNTPLKNLEEKSKMRPLCLNISV